MDKSEQNKSKKVPKKKSKSKKIDDIKLQVKKVKSEKVPKKEKTESKKIDNIKLQVKKQDDTPLNIHTTIINQHRINYMLNKILISDVDQKLLDKEVQYPINRNILDFYKHSKCSLKRDPKLDMSLKTEYKGKSTSTLINLKKQKEIIELIKQNSVVLIHGEPQSGTTTQVPQIILKEFINSGNGSLCKIVSTQPYKKYVMSAYGKVSEEWKKIFGNSVGISYQIRFDNHASRNAASITFCTTEILTKKASNSSFLNQITHLIIDEIQERDINTDFLLAFMKQLITTRTDIKLILICSSVYANKISKYFNKPPKINVSANLFPVDEYYLEDTIKLINFNNYNSKQYDTDNVIQRFVKEYEKTNELNPYLIKSLLNFLCSKTREGNILILLPTAANVRFIETKIENDEFLISKTQVVNMTCPDKTDNSCNTNRKIFLSHGEKYINLFNNKILFVIDSGKIQIKFYDIITNTEIVKNDWISKKTLNQRKNLAGRYKSGLSFHLISQNTIEHLDKYPIPQIMLYNLEKIILEIKRFGIENAEQFLKDCLTTPDNYCFNKTIEMFKNNNILTDQEYLTPLGYHVSKLPLKFSVGKMVILGTLFRCLDPILTIAAHFSTPNIFKGSFKEIQDIKQRYLNECDILLLVHLLDKLKHSEEKEDVLKEHFLKPTLIQDVNNITEQLKIRLIDMNFLPNNFDDKLFNINSANIKLIKALLAIALYPNIAVIRNHNSIKLKEIKMETITKKPCHIHSSSINSKRSPPFPSPILMYRSSSEQKKITLHDTTFLTPLQVSLFANNIKYSTVIDECIINVAGTLKIHCSRSTCEIIKKVQANFNNWLEYKLKNPGWVNWEDEEDTWDATVLRAVIALLENEE